MVYHDQRQPEEYCRVSDAWCTTITDGQNSIAESQETHGVYVLSIKTVQWSLIFMVYLIIVDQKDYTPDENSIL